MPVILDRDAYAKSKREWAAFVESLLERTGINASDLADLAGVSRQAVSKWRDLDDNAIPGDEARTKMIAFAQKKGLLRAA